MVVVKRRESTNLLVEIIALKGEALAVEMDVTSEEQVVEGFRKIAKDFRSERVDVLVANAGFQHIAPFVESTLTDWQKMVRHLSILNCLIDKCWSLQDRRASDWIFPYLS